MKQKLDSSLNDLLEDNVDENFYLSEKLINRFQLTDKSLTKNIVGTTIKNDDGKDRIGQRALVYNDNGIIGCLTASDYKEPKKILLTTQLEIIQSKQEINKCLKDILADEVEEKNYA